MEVTGDGYCDDATNIPVCEFDGGDCCLPNVHTDYCIECQCLELDNKIYNEASTLGQIESTATNEITSTAVLSKIASSSSDTEEDATISTSTRSTSKTEEELDNTVDNEVSTVGQKESTITNKIISTAIMSTIASSISETEKDVILSSVLYLPPPLPCHHDIACHLLAD